MNMETETFRPLPNYEGLYSLSNYGNVFSHRLGRNLSLCGKDYLNVKLSKEGIVETLTIHIAVCTMYCNHNPETNIVNHLDGNKHNNYYKNLESTDYLGNLIHAFTTGLNSVGMREVSLFHPDLGWKTCTSIESFCRETKNHRASVTRVLNGTSKHSKLWFISEEACEAAKIVLTHSDHGTQTRFKYADFKHEFGADTSKIRLVWLGDRKSHKGWTKIY